MGLVSLQSILVPLTAVLGLSLTVERILEVVKNILERLIGTKEGRKIPALKEADALIEDLELKLEKDRLLKLVEEDSKEAAKELEQLQAILKTEKKVQKRKKIEEKIQILKGELDEHYPPNVILVQPASDPDDGTTLRKFIIQIFGFAIGIFLAHYSGIQLFNCFLKALGKPEMHAWMDYLFTGLLIGGGSGPMHVLVRFVTERKFTVEEELSSEVKEDTREKQTKSAPALVQNIATVSSDIWIDTPYNGGVDREKLETVHRRKKNPDLIVYHHTAMDSRSSFNDVVRVIKDKSWITGYHCVIQYDGAIHPFCRWDRYGNHAKGNNMHSLGIAFNGNFETNPKVPFSNPDGSRGPSRPSEKQLKAGARIVTLWGLIYAIDFNFDEKIIPHNKISDKTCPGNSFPYDEFKKWIDFYCIQWNKSEEIKDKIEAFKIKPYLYL